MPHVLMTTVLGVVLATIASWLWRRWRRAQQSAHQQFVIFQFEELRDDLQKEFLQAAAATGKPRGLRWKQCDLSDSLCFAEDLASRELVALVGATISFEAIEGGDMEDVEAVGNLRFATAIFVYRQEKWTTEGRVIFNLEPPQALERFQETLRPVQELAPQL